MSAVRSDRILRVAVVGGGPSAEHDVSVATADAVQRALVAGGHHVVRLDLARDGGWRATSGADLAAAEAVARIEECDVLFPLVHGPGGEDGTLAGLASAIGVPCVGSGVGAGALAMDKWATKLVAEAVGVPTAAGALARPGQVPAWSAPVVVKPVAAGSSQGVSLVADAESFDAALAEAFAHDDRVLVEEVLVGREIDIAVLRRADGSLLVSPPLEIEVAGFFDYEAKYDGSARFVVPAPLTPQQGVELERCAVAVFEALGCAGVARVDFFLTERGWVLNEVNTVPGMTAHSQVPVMLAAAGITYEALCAELVVAAVGRAPAPGHLAALAVGA